MPERTSSKRSKTRSKTPGKAGKAGSTSSSSGWTAVHWSMIATWITLVSTILFNVQFYFIYQNMQQGPLFNTLLTEYSDPLILDALGLIEVFAKKYPKDDIEYAYEFLVLKHANDPVGRELDHARRRLVSWYQKVAMFYEFNLLSSTYFDAIPGRSRAEYFVALVEPMDTFNRQVDKRPVHKIFDMLRREYGLSDRNVTLDLERLVATEGKRNEKVVASAQRLRQGKQEL